MKRILIAMMLVGAIITMSACGEVNTATQTTTETVTLETEQLTDKETFEPASEETETEAVTEVETEIVTTTTEKISSEEFLADMAKGLSARWAISGGNLSPEYMQELAQAELDHIAEYRKLTFNDEELERLAKEYIKQVDLQLEAGTEGYSVVSPKWGESGWERTKLIGEINENYGIPFDEENQAILSSVLAEYNDYKVADEDSKAITDQIKKLSVDVESTSDGWTTYSILFENTSSKKNNDLYMETNLYDADGVIVNSSLTNTIGSLPAGEKAKLTFDTDVEFSDLSWDVYYNFE